VQYVEVLAVAGRAAPRALLGRNDRKAGDGRYRRAFDRGALTPLVERGHQVPTSLGGRDHRRHVGGVPCRVPGQPWCALTCFPESGTHAEAGVPDLAVVHLRVVLMPVVRLESAAGGAGCRLQDDIRDVSGRDICVVPLLGDGARISFGVVHENDKAPTELQPGRVCRVVGLEILKVGGDLSGRRRSCKAFILVIDRPLDVAHLGHLQQQWQPVVGLARVLPIGSPPGRNAQSDASVLHGANVVRECDRIVGAVVAERRRVKR